MWKNQTVPNLNTHLLQPNSSASKNPPSNMIYKHPYLPKPQEKQQNRNEIYIECGSFQYDSKQSISFDKKSRSKSNWKQSSINCNSRNLYDKSHSQLSTKSKQQDRILMQLQQNEQLRMNLFRAQKTIRDLDEMCKAMQAKTMELLQLKKQQVKQYTKLSNKVGNKNKGQKNGQLREQLKNKDEELQKIWRNNYLELVQYVSNYIKDISFLAEQYKMLENKNQQYRNSSKKARKSQQNLIKILQQSNNKLQRSQLTIEKLIQDIRERDIKIQDYQFQNKTLNINILEQREEIEKLRRQSKQEKMGGLSYKEVAKNLKRELQNMTNICKQYERDLANWEKTEKIYKSNQEELNQRVKGLEQQLFVAKNFSNNLLGDYKKISTKINFNEDKLNEKYLHSENIYEEKMRQYQKYISILHKERQVSSLKLEQKLFEKTLEAQKLGEIKITLEKQLLERTAIINQLQQELTKSKQKSHHMQLDFQTHLQQKDRQIQYLQELKMIANQKNEQLKRQIQQIRNDMTTILQQLKIKQLQIEKIKETQQLKYISSKNYESSVKTLKNSLVKIEKCQSKLHIEIQQKQIPKIQQQKEIIKQVQEKERQNTKEGLVWKKLKRDSAYEENSIQQPHKIRVLSQNNGNKTISLDFNVEVNPKKERTAQSLKNDRLPTNFQKQLIQNLQNYESDFTNDHHFEQIQVHSSIQAQAPKEKVETPRNKFNLQAFQNKMVIEESAKMFLKFNKTILR